MKILAGLFGTSSLLLATATHAQIPPQALNSAATTPDFIKAAAQSDLFEIEEGKLATQWAEDSRVRSFGQMMVQAHMQTTQGLKQAVAQAGLPAPPEPGLGPDEKIQIAQLKAMKGSDFDHEYLLQQAGAHHAALMVMQTYAAQGDAPPLRQAASTSAPQVAQHLSTILALQQSGR